MRRRSKKLRHVGLTAGATGLLLLAGCDHQSRISVMVAGHHEKVARGMTLAEAVTHFRLHPRSGRLLDVQGNILRPSAFPGLLLLNGRPAPRNTVLQNGNRIRTLPGHDQTEPTVRQLVSVPKGIPANPQFLLSRIPGVDVLVRGAISHELVSARFHPVTAQSQPERAVALTFDDGPSPTATRPILRLLKRFHAPATFFLVGYLAEQYPELVAMEKRYGMSIGNHTYNHPEVPPFAKLPTQLLRDEIRLGAESLARIGVQPGLLRPPGGSYSATVVTSARTLGERVVLWSVDPRDWRAGTTARQIAARVLHSVRAGSIVILHDGGGDRSATIRALPTIVKGIRRKGLRLIAIAAR